MAMMHAAPGLDAAPKVDGHDVASLCAAAGPEDTAFDDLIKPQTQQRTTADKRMQRSRERNRTHAKRARFRRKQKIEDLQVQPSPCCGAVLCRRSMVRVRGKQRGLALVGEPTGGTHTTNQRRPCLLTGAPTRCRFSNDGRTSCTSSSNSWRPSRTARLPPSCWACAMPQTDSMNLGRANPRCVVGLGCVWFVCARGWVGLCALCVCMCVHE